VPARKGALEKEVTGEIKADSKREMTEAAHKMWLTWRHIRKIRLNQYGACARVHQI